MKFSSIIESPIPAFNESNIFDTNEAIAYQRNDQFGPDLEVILNEYKVLVDSGANNKTIKSNKELKEQFESTVFNRLGLKVKLITDEHLAAVIPNVFVPHSGAVRDAMRSALHYDNKALGQKQLKKLPDKGSLGTVNTQTAKLTGWFSEQEVPVYFNFLQLFKTYKLSTAEVAAICLHEFGHGFDSAAKSFTVSQSNMVIGDIVKYISSSDRGGDVEYIYREFKKLDPNISKDVVEGLRSDNAVVFGISAFRATLGSVENLSGSKAYNRTTNEAFADSFAVRFNYGQYLATGLDKLINSPGYKLAITFNDLSAVTVYAWLIYDIVRMLATMSVVPGYGLLNLVFRIITAYVLSNQLGHKTHDYEYDTSADRIKRIEENVIGALKDPELDKEAKRSILAQLEIIQEVYANTSKLPNVTQKLISVFFASDRNSMASTKIQRQIEAVLANQLFVAAAKLDVKE